ncbi:MAG: lipocalin-like domain-containing protein [Burkholderiales bacterium]
MCAPRLLFALLLSLLLSTAPLHAEEGDENPLVGTWKLVSVIYRQADGSPAATDWGENPQGLLIYDSSGNMAVQISRADRSRFKSGDRRQGSAVEIKAAFESYMAYFGRYEVDWDQKTVTHILTACTFPNWTGTSQRRFFELNGERITLRTPPYPLGGQTVTGSLVWERISQ